MKPFLSLCFLLSLSLLSCNNSNPHTTLEQPIAIHAKDINISSSNKQLIEVFNWAKEKAYFYVQTGKKGPLEVWERGEGHGNVDYIPSYWAGYPGRSAFYSRDFCHQLPGAHLLGLQEENFTMLKAFAASADAGKKWYPLWAINFDGSPYMLDYKNDDNFVREVPATFELVEKAYQLYTWTGDKRIIEDEVLWNYYTKVVTEFIDLHDTQIANGIAEGTGKGIFDGAASFNEKKDHPLIEAGDAIATQFKALEAYSKMAEIKGASELAKSYAIKATNLKAYFNNDWGIKNTDSYNRGYLADGTSVDGWGKENSWFMPMKGLTAAGTKRTKSYLNYINERLESKDDIPDNIEALSYIPETFFLHHENDLGWKWMQHIMNNLKQDHAYESATGRNGDYPEVSYVLIQNMIVDLLGVAPNATKNSLASLSHLPAEIEQLGVENMQIGTSFVSLSQIGNHTSKLKYQQGEQELNWKAGFIGQHDFLYVNGEKLAAKLALDNGVQYSYVVINAQLQKEVVVSVNP